MQNTVDFLYSSLSAEARIFMIHVTKTHDWSVPRRKISLWCSLESPD